MTERIAEVAADFLTADEFRRYVSGEIHPTFGIYNSIADMARAHSLCAEQLRLFLRGKRPPEPAILKAFSMEAHTVYQRSNALRNHLKGQGDG